MPFLVQGSLDDHVLAVTADTANEAFAKAIEWHVVEKFFDVSIERQPEERALGRAPTEACWVLLTRRGKS